MAERRRGKIKRRKTMISDFKREILKQEIQIVHEKINHFDSLRHRTKQMAITLWIAAFGFGVSQDTPWVIALSIVIPLPFWYIESIYHANQEGFIGRFWAIRQFIRDGEFEVGGKRPPVTLADCMRDENFGEFPVPDYFPNKTFSEEELRRRISVKNNFLKTKMFIFYAPPILVAIVGWIFK